MNPGHSRPEQLLALPRGVFDPEFSGGRIVVAQRVKPRRHGRGDARAAHRGEPLDLSGTQDRNNARHDGHAHAELVCYVVAEFKEVGVVEEQLREDEVRAGIHLLLQMLPIGVLALFARDMALGKTRHADREITLLANEAHQLAGELKSAGSDLELAPAGRVAPQRQEISDPQRANAAKQFADLLPGGADACQVSHGRQSVLPLDTFHDHERLVARAAPGAVRDGAIVRLCLEQGGNGLSQQVAVALVRFRGEELERNHRAPGEAPGRVDVASKVHELPTCAMRREKPSREPCNSKPRPARGANSVYHILRLALQEGAHVFHGDSHETRAGGARGPGQVRRDEAIPGGKQRVVCRRGFD